MIFLLIISVILLASLIYSMCWNIKLNNRLCELCKGKSDYEKQRISFVYGNVKLSNPEVTIEMVEQASKDIKCPVENTPDFKECKNCQYCAIIRKFI